MSETPIYDELLTQDRWLETATFPWEAERGEDAQEWELYLPSLRDQVVDLSGRIDYTTYTSEHADELKVMLNDDGESLLGLSDDPQRNPDVVAVPSGSDSD